MRRQEGSLVLVLVALVGLLLMFLAMGGCCPVMVAEEYPPIETAKGWCSWSLVGERTIVTAAHCVADDGIAVLGEGELSGAALVSVDEARDVAEFQLYRDPPEGARRHGASRAPGWLEIACYVDFEGEPNCGRVLALGEDRFTWSAETRAVRDGDSGAALVSRGGDFLGVLSTRSLAPDGALGHFARVD